MKLRARRIFQIPAHLSYQIGALLLIVLVILRPIRTTARILERLPDYQTFAADFDQREQTIRDAVARGETRLTVAPLQLDVAAQIGLDTIGADPDSWVNRCAAQYYGLESLTVE